MRQFIKHLTGGAALIVVSLLVGIAYNTLIDNKVKLLPAFGNQSVVVAALSDTTTAPATGDSTAVSESDTVPPAVAGVAPGIQGIVPLEKVKALFDGKVALFIDAREAESYDEGHIPGALNIPYDKLVDYYETLTATVSTDQLVVVYCWSPTCDFSDSLASEMVFMGYTNIVIFRGGWDEWKAAGYPGEGIKLKQ